MPTQENQVSDATKPRPDRMARSAHRPTVAAGAGAVGAQAVGALALGAFAIGALAIGALAIGRLAIGRARVRRLEIDELVVGRLHLLEHLPAPRRRDTEQ
ncbi:hypothetical protein [Rhodoferax koreensis]|nr:hypothetical protein [Rhodoferax koreense]